MARRNDGSHDHRPRVAHARRAGVRDQGERVAGGEAGHYVVGAGVLVVRVQRHAGCAQAVVAEQRPRPAGVFGQHGVHAP